MLRTSRSRKVLNPYDDDSAAFRFVARHRRRLAGLVVACLVGFWVLRRGAQLISGPTGTTYLITGGAGFIGDALTQRILATEPGARIVIIDTNLPQQEILDHKRVTYLQRDLRSPDTLLEWAAAHGVEYVLVASTGAVYGDAEVLPTPETAELNPRSTYATTKVAMEAAIEAFTATNPLHLTVARLFGIYGPRESRKSEGSVQVASMIDAALTRQSLLLHGDGGTAMDLMYIDDCVEVLVRLIEKRPRDRYLNVGSGVATPLRVVANRILDITESSSGITYLPPQSHDVPRMQADVSNLVRAVGPLPSTPLDQGLTATITYVRRHTKIF